MTENMKHLSKVFLEDPSGKMGKMLAVRKEWDILLLTEVEAVRGAL